MKLGSSMPKAEPDCDPAFAVVCDRVGATVGKAAPFPEATLQSVLVGGLSPPRVEHLRK